MSIKFNLPATRTCKVVYARNGVNYQAIITTPKSNDELQRLMLSRQVGMSQIATVEPIQAQQFATHTHPAQNRIAQYQTLSER